MTLGIMATLLFIIGLFPHVGNFSHIGGFVFGMLLGYAFFRTDHWDWSIYQSSPIGNRVTDFNYDMNYKVCKTFLWATMVIILVIL